MADKLPDDAIEHVVVLMLENRGFDHIMGWLYPKAEDGEAPRYTLSSYGGDARPFMGLSSLSADELAALANPPPDAVEPLAEEGVQKPLEIRRGARSPKTPSFNTGESFEHIMNQMWGEALSAPNWLVAAERRKRLAEFATYFDEPPMTGYVRDYDQEVFEHTKTRLGMPDLSEVLDTYLPEQVPVLSGLARSYAVSDEWYCSVPSQTNTNRAFSMTGTSRGMVNNSFYDPPTFNPGVKAFANFAGGKSHADSLPESTRCLFEVMQEAGFSWKVYWQEGWPPYPITLGVPWQYTRTMVPFLQDKLFDGNFAQYDPSKPDNPLFADIAAGSLPALTWIEPKWGGGPSWDSPIRTVGNDYHPVSDTTVGEDFVMSVYQALVQGPQWAKTLFVITFDENGGTYDHMPPPEAPAPGNESCPLPHPRIYRHDMEPTDGYKARTQFGFDFKQYGVRVPTLLISPRIPPNTVFRSPTQDLVFDHTSLIATILKLAKIDPGNWLLGRRVAEAPTFEGVIAPPQAPDNKPDRPLSILDGRSKGAELAFNTPYILQHVVDPWGDPNGPKGFKYLAAQTDSKAPTYRYPTLSGSPYDAVPITLQPLDGSAGQGTIGNMSNVRIVTSEAPSRLSGSNLAVSHLHSWAFYSSERSNISEWQVRLLGSRERGDRVREGDRLYLVSQLPPNLVQRVSEHVTPDPFQRLVPHPTDKKNLTTRAGEWGLWRIIPVPPPPSAN